MKRMGGGGKREPGAVPGRETEGLCHWKGKAQADGKDDGGEGQASAADEMRDWGAGEGRFQSGWSRAMLPTTELLRRRSHCRKAASEPHWTCQQAQGGEQLSSVSGEGLVSGLEGGAARTSLR